MTLSEADQHDVAEASRSQRDTTEAIDALYRFGAGQDMKDEPLFLSAFAPDATLDFTHPARHFGGEVPVFVGRDAIREILPTLEPLVTTHTVTNPRVTLDGDRATLWCLVEAQHVDRQAPARHLLLKNRYDVDLVRDGDRFVITSMTIHTMWSDGDPSVLFGAGAVAPAAI
jgi:hypothetical protein